MLGAWPAKESVRDVYLAENVKGTKLVDKAITRCPADEVPEIQTLDHTSTAVASNGMLTHQQRPEGTPHSFAYSLIRASMSEQS